MHLIKNSDENSIIDHIYHHALKEDQSEKIAQALLLSYRTEHSRLPIYKHLKRQLVEENVQSYADEHLISPIQKMDIIKRLIKKGTIDSKEGAEYPPL
ncbi:MAG: hypothetical protein QRY74_00460 [Chlamydia sp.]